MFGLNAIYGPSKFNDVSPDQLKVTSRFLTIQGEGPFSSRVAYFIRLTHCSLACSWCFVPSTKITMGDGTKKRIDQIQVNDIVMSWSGEKFEPKRVTKTFKSNAQKLLRVETTSSSHTTCTPEHPFLVSGKGWVEAKDLQPNDVLVNYTLSDRMKQFNPAFSPETKSSMSPEARKVASQKFIDKWKTDEFRSIVLDRMNNNNPMKDPAIAYKSYVNRVNSPKSGLETRVEKICEGLPIKYVGNGDLHIGYKIPDFVVQDQKKVIEVWAADAPWVKARPRDVTWMHKRREHFAKYGYEVMFLPLIQKELNSDNHKNIREKVAQFINNGIVVKSIKEVSKKGIAALYKSKDADLTVYNFEVEDYHTYVANNLVVHNCDAFFDEGDFMTFDEIEADIEAQIDKYFNGNVPEYAKSGLIQTNMDTGYVKSITLEPIYQSYYKQKDMVLVITGGEPMLQKNIGQFLLRMNRIFKHTQIESNGTYLQDIPDETILVVSPKCSEKNGQPVRYLTPRPEVLERANVLKFVVSADPDSKYHNIPDWAYEWKNKTGRDIYISPMNIYNDLPQKAKDIRDGRNTIDIENRSTADEVVSFWEEGLFNKAENQKNHEYAGRLVIQHGFVLNLQQHLYVGIA